MQINYYYIELKTLKKKKQTNNQTNKKNGQTLSQPKPWYFDNVLNFHHGYYTTIMTSRRLFRRMCIMKYHVVQISRSENRNSYSVEKLNNNGAPAARRVAKRSPIRI